LTVKVLEESDYIRRLKEADSIEAESRLENIQELLGAIKRYDETYPTEGLLVFLEQVALISDIDRLEMGDDTVKLMTCHSAKGLEFDMVFLTGLEEGLLPHSRSIQDARQLEEERRLCYVALTRAKKRLFLTWSLRRLRGGGFTDAMPSRFLREMPPEVLFFESGNPDDIFGHLASTVKQRSGRVEKVGRWITSWGDVDSRPKKTGVESQPSAFRKGDVVTHDKWGRGEVHDVRDVGGDHFITVRFDDFGSRLLSENKANLKKIDM
jgi:DNA helicase-2/ATP-dependent DNA helicase PcrA